MNMAIKKGKHTVCIGDDSAVGF